MSSPWLPVPTAVENTLTPGALMSGLSWPSPMRGPPELNDANRRNDGLAMVVLASVAVAGLGVPYGDAVKAEQIMIGRPRQPGQIVARE